MTFPLIVSKSACHTLLAIKQSSHIVAGLPWINGARSWKNGHSIVNPHTIGRDGPVG
jgi:hypothetical protein